MKPSRFYALDLLRTCAILVVTFYHVWETSYGQDKMLFSASQSVFGLLTPFFLNYWGYSGLILAIISFFLIGYSQKRFNWKRLLLVSTGLIGMIVHEQASAVDTTTWDWNLYGYLLVSLLVVQTIPNIRWLLYAIAAVSVASLLIPIEFYQQIKTGTHPLLDQILVGDLDVNTTIGWGLLPWLAIPLIGFCAGRLFRSQPQSTWVHSGLKSEVPALLVLASILVLLFPMNENISISTTGFYYYVFSGSLWFFWSRFLVIFIWMRLACLNSVNDFLGGFTWVRWLSGLAWNRNFGLCYFAQFMFLPLAAAWSGHFASSPRLIDLYWIALIVATELLARLLLWRLKSLELFANKILSRA